MNDEYENGVSICITAYKAKEFIKETLDSVEKQTWFKNHDNWEVLIGIDNCYETLEYVQGIMSNYRNLRVFMMSSNMGTYVTTNTIMSLAKYDGLIRFDSDDIMLPELVETIMKEKGKADFVNFKMENFGRSGNRRGISQAGGQVYISHKIFDKFGGYLPWTCSADTELEIRMKKFVKTKMISKVLMRRRIHSNNLTIAKATNFSSEVRKKNLKYCRLVTSRFKKEYQAKIEKITNTYCEVFPDTNINDFVFINEIQKVVIPEENYEQNEIIYSAETIEEEPITERIAKHINEINLYKENIRKARKNKKIYGGNKLNLY